MPGIASALALIILLLLIVPAPLGTDRRVHRFPIVTVGLVAFNSIILLMSSFSPTGHATLEATTFYHWGLVPASVRVTAFLTYMFVHVSVSHLVWNMLFLWLFGPHVEDALGRATYLAVYLIGGIAAGLLHVAIVLIFAPHSPAAFAPLFGASGAVSTILGLFALRYYSSRIRVYWVPAGMLDRRGGVFEAPALLALGIWLLATIVMAVTALFHSDLDGIAYWAHLGGFIFGIVAGYFMDLIGEGTKDYLVLKARTATRRGGARSLADAARKYRLALQRRPADEEARKALAALPDAFPLLTDAARDLVRHQYSDLIEYFVKAEQPQVAQMWVDEATARGYAPKVSPATLLGLGEYHARAGSAERATRLLEHVIERYPGRLEADRAYLELAKLQLGASGNTREAAETLRKFLKRQESSSADQPHVA